MHICFLEISNQYYYLLYVQSLLSISVATRLAQEDPAFASIKSLNYKQMLLLSLGTGTNSEFAKNYTAEEAAKWGILQWMSPIWEMRSAASSYMNDYYLSTVFQALDSQNNYLRVQVSPNYYYYYRELT